MGARPPEPTPASDRRAYGAAMTTDLATVAPAFVELAPPAGWGAGATRAPGGPPPDRRPQPVVGVGRTGLGRLVRTEAAPPKRPAPEAPPFVSVNYWAPSHDTCAAECGAELLLDLPA